MRLPSRLALTGALIVSCASAAASDPVTFTETFDNDSNVGLWSWGTGNEFINPLNGNPARTFATIRFPVAAPQ